MRAVELVVAALVRIIHKHAESLQFEFFIVWDGEGVWDQKPRRTRKYCQLIRKHRRKTHPHQLSRLP